MDKFFTIVALLIFGPILGAMAQAAWPGISAFFTSVFWFLVLVGATSAAFVFLKKYSEYAQEEEQQRRECEQRQAVARAQYKELKTFISRYKMPAVDLLTPNVQPSTLLFLRLLSTIQNHCEAAGLPKPSEEIELCFTYCVDGSHGMRAEVAGSANS